MNRAALLALTLCLATSLALAQKKSEVPTSSLCTPNNALETTKEQILFTRTIDNVPQRIAVLLRAGELLWPHDREKALAAFMQAFDLSVQEFKEKGDEVSRTSKSRFAAVIAVPDQRFKVISALAKLDSARARKLSDQVIEDEAREAADKPTPNNRSQVAMAEKLLTTAHSMIEIDREAAINFARVSLRYPATMYLPIFLYELAKANKSVADQFYLEALNSYKTAPMDRFLYLSAYPFGNAREAGEMPGYTFYRIPEGYEPNRPLQVSFMDVLLARSEASSTSIAEQPSNRYSEQAQMWLALTRLEKQVQENLPDLADAASRAKDKLFALLNPSAQQSVTSQITQDNAPKRGFDEQVETAEKTPDINRRDFLLTNAVTALSKDEPIDKVLSVIDKISDASIRPPLENWFYYFRTQALIADKNLSEAKKLAARVTALDQRAYLFTRIAEESLKVAEDQSELRQMLSEVAETVNKAPKTIVSARALLALAYLYAKVDSNRAVMELGNAVKTINALESPDFSQQFVMMTIEGKSFGSYASFSTPGFNPENAFRELGKLDFDGSLLQATTFSDKSLRALTTLAVVEPCFVSRKKAQKTQKN